MHVNKLLERIPGRTLAIVVALLLAAVATVSLNDYVTGQSDQAAENAEFRSVWYVLREIGPGTSFNVAFALQDTENPAFGTRAILAESVTETNVTDLTSLTDLFASGTIRAGEPLLTTQWDKAAPDIGAFELSEGMVAASIDVGVTAGVANFLDVDDLVTLVAHAAGGDADAAGPTSRILLQNVRIVAIGRRVTAGVTPGQADQVLRSDEQMTITFELSPADAERLVFAQFETSLYVLLQADGDTLDTTTNGRSAGNVFG